MFKFIKKLFKNDDEEIERKWLINDIPNYILKRTTCMPYIQIKQKYLAINNVEEIRIRELKTYRKYTLMDGKYYIGVKRGSGLVREEKRLPILKHTFNDLNSSNNDIPIMKTRYQYDWKFGLITIDQYLNGDVEMVAEVEFNSEKEANNFVEPDWFGKEVTDDSYYKNKNIFKRLNGWN
jgi:CYTH domain-containing protein